MPGTSAETLFINGLFSAALEKKATDIHLMPGNYPVFRVDARLHVLADQKVINAEFMTSFVDTLLSKEQKQRLLAEREVRTIYTWADRARFRASIFYQQGYPAISFRLIPPEVPDPKQLFIPDHVTQLATKQQGLILISGPYNSGRTTTVASLLQYINEHFNKHILTLEQPIEYALINSKSVVTQREVGRDTPTFSHGVRDATEEDVEVVGIGELDEAGIYELIITLVESGKLVLAIMNATSAISALEKFVDSIPPDRRQWAKDALSNMLLAVLNQRLVPGVRGGSVLAVEVITLTPATASIIQSEKFVHIATIMQTSREEGMITLDARLGELVRGGKIAIEEARKYALDPNSIHGS